MKSSNDFFLRFTAKHVKIMSKQKLETIKPSRKPPSGRVFQKDEMDVFTKLDHRKSLSDTYQSSSKSMRIFFMLKWE